MHRVAGVLTVVAATLAVAVAPAGAAKTIEITQTASKAIVPGVGISCEQDSTHYLFGPNSYLRRFDLAGAHKAKQGFHVSKASIAVGEASAPSTLQPATFELFAIPPSAPLTNGNLELLASKPLQVSDSQAGSVLSTSLNAKVPKGRDLVVQFSVPDGVPSETLFFPGANEQPQAAEPFIVAPDCSTTEPTPLGEIGFPDSATVIFAQGVAVDCKKASAKVKKAKGKKKKKKAKKKAKAECAQPKLKLPG